MRKKKILAIIFIMQLITIAISVTSTADWSPGDGHKMHFPQLPDPFGWDVDATYVLDVFPQNGLADDWLCSETGPVTEIHFWGSWYNDLVGDILGFVIIIAEDIPADPPHVPYSKPGDVLWERTFSPGEWLEAGPWESLQGWYDPGEGFYVHDNHLLYWQYNFEDIEDPFIQIEDTIYWLFVSAVVHLDDPQPRWGWKSSMNHWNDDAVHGYWTSVEWYEIREPPDFITSLDLSFVIDGIDEPLNNPPNTPNPLSGPSNGEVNEYIPYSTSTTDPDNDNIRYGIDFDSDGVVDHWSVNFYPSGATYNINILFGYPGTYYLRVKAEDVHGAQSDFSLPKVVMISGENDPPNTPSLPTGPSTGAPADSLTFSTSSTDPDGDQIKYGWDWDGDGTVDEWSGLQNSGTTDTRSHTWIAEGTYQVQVKAEDEHGAQSAFSPIKTVIISANNAPSKPVISGPSSGKIGKSYTYSASTTDPESDNIYYWFDWGDGTNTGWVGPFTSGQSATESHTWNTQGSFSIKVKSKDMSGLESTWSDPLSITMPKNSVIRNQILRFINNHPILSHFLQILLEYS